MAIKERLLKQLNIVRDGLNAMPPFHSRDLNAMRNALVQARDLCFQGLSSDRVSDYQDVYDGLLLAADQLAEGAEDGQTIASLCQDLLQYLSGQTQKETSFKKEIVFLPYQASMWDSLESVWKAANEDKEHCNTYVIPIPYCDRNPDMTAAQWHCERGMFPKYVPTLDWREVNLEEWHPDVIFIHNAYDDQNAVTSVDSSYYSRNLKKCTDKLVYIPYAVEEEVQPGNEAIEEAISHRVLQPGVLNADLVIAQSEDTRQAWINILVRHTNVKDRAYWESRILGLGSPKIDKVLTSKREDFDMPEKWRKLIEGKKVILYNTSLGAMLQNSDKVCDKLRYVFDIFRNRDDVVLWWRPHPLMKSTIHAMRPQFEEEYLSIEKQYIEEGWGIYDDSSDLHRAICWSDAYYGDYSSVIQLYKKTGKTILLQDFDSTKLSDPKNSRFYFPLMAKDGERIWFISSGDIVCALYQLDLNLDKLECLGEIPAPYDTGFEYGALGKMGDIIVLAPYFGDGDFVEYSLSEKRFRMVRLSVTIERYPFAAFSNVINWNDSLFFIGNMNGWIVEYRRKDKRYIAHSVWNDDLRREGIEREEIRFAWNANVQINNVVYMPVYGKNWILKLELPNCSVKVNRLPIDFSSYRMCCDGINFWLISNEIKDSSVLKWNENQNSCEKIKLTSDSNKQLCFIDIICAKNILYCFPLGNENGIFMLDINSKNACWSESFEPRGMAEVYDAKDDIFLYHFRERMLYKVDLNGKKINKYEMNFPIRDYEKRYEQLTVHQDTIPADETFGPDLTEMMKWCVKVERTHENRMVSSSNYGRDLFDKYKEIIYG